MKTVGRWFVEHIVPLGAPGLFLLALIDSGGLPIPQGVDVLLFAQTTAHPGAALLYASLATLGSLAGCLFLYYVSRAAGHAALARRTSPERIDAMRRQFEKYEALTLVLPTMIPLPLPMKLFIIAAGVFQVRLPHFIGAILFARTVRFFGIAFLARSYGDQAWTYVRQNLAPVLVGVLLLLGLFYLASRRLR
jgi:membrane protein YqaA with SNARE-associated domain